MKRMSRFSLVCVTAGLLCSAAFLAPAFSADGASDKKTAIPNFNPDGQTAWSTNRLDHDDFMPPPSGPGPVTFDPAHPYVPNQGGQPTYRVSDLTNPILKDWVKEQMKKTNDEVLAGGVPFIARERCWPIGVPGFVIWNRGQPLHIIQTPTKVLMINELYAITRHIYLDVPHSKNPKPSWWGESVGHYEGDTLVVDTIGMNTRTFVDNYRTPHTEQLHVIERFKLVDGGKLLHVDLLVDDPGAFNMPWRAVQEWRRLEKTPFIEDLCEPNNDFFFGYNVAPLPHADQPDF
jgi:hypothetical protein